MTRHTRRTHITHSESKSQQGHLAQITHSDPMTKIVQQDTSLGLFPTSPFPRIPHYEKDLMSNPVW